MATAADVRSVDLQHELACYDDQQIQCLIDTEVACCMGDAWGEKLDVATALAAAHILAIAQNGSVGPVGPVTGQSAGGLSISFSGGAGSSVSDDYWNSTSFGRRYLRMQGCLLLTPLTLRCC